MNFNIPEKVSRMRAFIAEATRRLEADGYFDKHGDRRIALVIEKGELSYFRNLSEPGPFKIWVGLHLTLDKLIFHFWRIDENEATVGGMSGWNLPRRPRDLTKRTLPGYDPHYDRTGTIEDWEEMIRWVREGTVVDADYVSKCREKGDERTLKMT